MTENKRRSRCAIYTRKSTEEGLEQAFNSLDAQREACAAYVASQVHEGWSLVPDLYDDGGFSGGNMDRPGLKHLLADIKANKVDVIVVYKVDRLTRSLADFAKIVEVLDRAKTSFVSVTQAFNTTTSMGRLTLNVLLSFAQFEREMTSERIRDKIAASKARGMWMGGVVPLGYEVENRKLFIVPSDAAKVRFIFARYLELGSVLSLQSDLADKGFRSRERTSKAGKRYGNAIFSRGALYLMLQNRLYLGEMPHKGKSFPGEHEGIVNRDLFDRVTARLDDNRRNHSDHTHADVRSFLAGRLWDSEGRRMSPDHATKGTRRYRYYASRIGVSESSSKAIRVPAGDLEELVLNHRATCALSQSDPKIKCVDDESMNRALNKRSIQRVTVHRDHVEIETESLNGLNVTRIPIAFVRSGKETILAIRSEAAGYQPRRDPALIKLIVKAHLARRALESCTDTSVANLAAMQGYSRDYFGVLLRIAYLAPDIVKAILDGRQPVQLNRQRLARATSLPIDWQAQREMFGFTKIG